MSKLHKRSAISPLSRAKCVVFKRVLKIEKSDY
jgi:hypothetical protein